MQKIVMSKKTKGDSTFLATLVAIFVMIVFFMSMFYVYAQIATQNKVERTYRQYLLRMEREGYLTTAEKSSLISDLTALGVKNIDLSGTSVSPVAYGGEITLHIVGDLEVDKIVYTGVTWQRQKGDVHIDILKTGTALY